MLYSKRSHRIAVHYDQLNLYLKGHGELNFMIDGINSSEGVSITH
jgi:hypothetical protein